LEGDVAAFGAKGAADADFARSLGDAGEHDVHDANAADEKRDAGDQDEQQFIAVAGPLGGFELIERDGDGPIFLEMRAFEQIADGGPRADHFFAVADFQGDLVKFDRLAGARTGLADEDLLTVAAAASAERNVDVVVEFL